jgi:predicted hydrocarbon binding protein
MTHELGRALPNRRIRRLMLSVQALMGQSGLTSLLKQAGLGRFAGALPANNAATVMRAAEYASLLQAIENYYGRGARGTLLRVGYGSFTALVHSQPARSALKALLLSIWPLGLKKRLALSWVAQELSFPQGRVIVTTFNQHLALEDYASDATFGRQRETEICWVTQGEITEALKWATGHEYVVTETACKAKGDAVCRFEVGERVG